jgi:hypothetical protein
VNCGVRSGELICDREEGHHGYHRGYNEKIDAPMFWADAKGSPWVCVMDFPSAWAFVREQHHDPKEHDPRCSWVQASGGILCDCHIINDEYERRKSKLADAVGQSPSNPI